MMETPRKPSSSRMRGCNALCDRALFGGGPTSACIDERNTPSLSSLRVSLGEPTVGRTIAHRPKGGIHLLDLA